MTALAYVGCALVWGTTWFAIRVCMGPGGFAPFAGAAIRFVIAVALLAVLVATGLAGRGPSTWRRRNWIGGARG